MSKKKILAAISIFFLAVLNILILCRRSPVSGTMDLELQVSSDRQQNIQVYYSADRTFSEEQSASQVLQGLGTSEELHFAVPHGTDWIRLDLGSGAQEYVFERLSIGYKGLNEDLLTSDLQKVKQQGILKLSVQKDRMVVQTDGEDPYMVIQIPDENISAAIRTDSLRMDWILNIVMLLFLDGGALVALIFQKKIVSLPLELIQSRKLILSLAKNDFKTKYAGSYLGIVWAFIQPIVTIFVYWFVFSVGLKSGNVDNYPFVLYLVSGIVPWFFFQEALNGGTNALIEYNYLVKKVVFKISILPIVKIISALFVHAFFVAFALILCSVYGYHPGLYTLQILYYSVCTFSFALGLVYATSAIVIFFRDLTQIINIVLQVGVWMTPIMWDLNMLSGYPLLMKLFKLNPMYYIVSGYRDAMLGKVWFWDAHWGWTIYFWIVTTALFALGAWIFKRLKPHFADVL